MRGRGREGQPLSGLRCQASVMRAGKPPEPSVMAGLKPEVIEHRGQEKPLSVETQLPVPQTDTGRWVEDTKANGRTLVKELGKLAP